MSARRIAQWLLVLTLGGVSPLSAQGRAGVQVPGMPDMSNAPADVQAILKKVMSGGIPTQAEAKKLSDYLLANKGAIAKSATSYGDSMKKRQPSRRPHSATSDQPACPTPIPLSPSLAGQPTSRIATALLDSIRQAYPAKLKPQALSILQYGAGKASDPAGSNQLASRFCSRPIPTAV